MKKRYFLPLLTVLSVPFLVVAQVNTGPSTGTTNINTGPSVGSPSGSLYNPLGQGTTLWTLVNGILAFIIKVGAVVIVFMLVYVGFLFVTARGNPKSLEDAKKALLWTIVGAVILLGAQVISQGVCSTVQALFPGNTISCG
ncbi:MAG: hypothetical protein KGI78_04620 [Patescibacteria group bacterium]|nr:hypothetical protein [Patescibacteria group bacterium]MDE1943931.1 hypothetical protein [Patescibacteria group bacterium]MDE1945478.1 hypothetical protein [Patescibacteria group bacterium]MDE2058093.1 hypothetical protein [Patescibacteria group bacterium]